MVRGLRIFHSVRHNVISEADGDMIVQSGITWEEVNDTLAQRNIPLFFPVSRSYLNIINADETKLDPGPGATIGGMIGTGCSGSVSLPCL
jgi:D-lactate dehydrogenase (cytochrome)